MKNEWIHDCRDLDSPPDSGGESLFWGGNPPSRGESGGKLSPPEVDFFEIFGKKILIFVNVFQKFRLRRIFCAFGAIEMEERRDIFHVKKWIKIDIFT